MGSPRRILEAEGVDGVALARQRGGGAGTGEAGADHDHAVVGALARADEPVRVQPVVPFVLERSIRDAGIQLQGHPITPVKNATGTAAKPTVTPTAITVESRRNVGLRLGLSHPPVWKKLQTA